MVPSFLAHPFGMLGLLAVPAILIIHLLRERSRRLRVSTLFLLEQLTPRTPRGYRIDRLQNSIPLWLQLLIALLATWLLADPRWLRKDSTQRVVAILDNTASMSAFRARAVAALPGILRHVSEAAVLTEWTVITSDSPETPLYRGRELTKALDSLAEWRPLLPNHDPAQAFALSLLHAGSQSTVFFVSDHAPESLPGGVQLVAFGERIANCGFAGIRTWKTAEGMQWEALVRNASSVPQERDWWTESDRATSQAQRLHLAPGEAMPIQGPFLPGENRITLHLTPDEFSLDDSLPIVAPEPKPMGVAVHGSEKLALYFKRMVESTPGARVEKDLGRADLAVVSSAEALALAKNQAAIVLAATGDPDAKSAVAGVVSESHPLVEGLVWAGLLCSGAGNLPHHPGDAPLLWLGKEPLVWLDGGSEAPRLLVNFDLDHSNADRLPAFVLLFSRFLAEVQSGLPADYAENFETHQVLGRLPAGAVVVPEKVDRRAEAGAHRAPDVPGFFKVLQGEKEWLRGAAHFGDAREADFQEAISTSPELARATTVRLENSVGDPLAPLWLGLIGAAFVVSWMRQAK